MKATATATASGSKARAPLPDMDAHTGLRGVAAVYILLFHVVVHSRIKWNFQGRSLMPLFFSLSGFSLAVVYGSKPWKAVGPFVGSLQGPVVAHQGRVEEEQCQPFESLKFYWNRFARIMPTYWLCTILAIPLVFLGYNEYISPAIFPQSLVVSVIPISTLFTIGKGYPIDTPGWFVCTLVMLYLCFPWLLTRAQRLTDDQLARSFFYLFWYQCATFMVSYFVMVRLGYGEQIAYSAGRNPISRIAVFQMGIHAGLLCLRNPTGPLPWPTTLLGLFPRLKISDHPAPLSSPEDQQRAWIRMADMCSIGLLLLTLGTSVVDIIWQHHNKVFDNLQSDVWLSCAVSFTQLTLVVALTRDGAQSLSSRALRTPFALWLGEISAALYLVHQVVEVWVQYATHGFVPLEWPPQDCTRLAPGTPERASCDSDWAHFKYMKTQLPWAMPICVAVAFAAAAAIYYLYERPIHRAMRKDKYTAPTAAGKTTGSGRLEVPLMAHSSSSIDDRCGGEGKGKVAEVV